MTAEIFIHPSAIIDDKVRLGTGTKVWHWVHISAGVNIGTDCVLGQNVFIGPGVTIGNGVKIQNNVSVFSGVTLADNVFCGPNVVFTNVINPRSFIERKNEFKPTYVAQGASLGANATIICGNTIGEYALIGAGSVVTHSVPKHALMVGNPGRQIGWVCECGERLALTSAKQGQCQLCTKVFTLDIK